LPTQCLTTHTKIML